MIVWDQKAYLTEPSKQLKDEEVYVQVLNDTSALVSTILKSLKKDKKMIWQKNTLTYFLVKDPKFARFYLLPKIHNGLFDLPEKPEISNCVFSIVNISSFLGFYLQTFTQKMNSYLKEPYLGSNLF